MSLMETIQEKAADYMKAGKRPTKVFLGYKEVTQNLKELGDMIIRGLHYEPDFSMNNINDREYIYQLLVENSVELYGPFFKLEIVVAFKDNCLEVA